MFKNSIRSMLLLVTCIWLLSACEDTARPPDSTVTSTPGYSSAAITSVKPSPLNSPSLSPMSTTPTPIIKSVVDSIVHAGVDTVRIFERSVQDYRGEQPIFYTESNVSVMVIPKTKVPITPEDLSQLPDRVKITSKSTKTDIRFKVDPIKPGDSNVIPLMLHLQEAPQEDVLIRFVALDGKQEHTITLRYKVPFRYSVTSDDDPGIAEYIANLDKGFYIVRHLELGKPYSYVFEFTQDVDRDSVTRRLATSIGAPTFSSVRLEWVNNRRLNVIIVKQTDPNSPSININLNGIRDLDGYMLSDQRQLSFQPSHPQALYRINLPTGAKTSLFASMVHYDEIEVSPNGQYGLAAIENYNEMYAIYTYSVIKLDGTVLHSFDIDAIHLVKWYHNGESIVYLHNNNVMHLNLVTGETTTIMAAPDSTSNARFVSLDTYSKSAGSIIAGWGTHNDEGKFTYDLYVFSDPTDNSPNRIRNVGTFSCYEGPCYAPGERTVKQDSLHLEQQIMKEDKWNWIAYELDLNSGEKKEAVSTYSPLDDGSKRIVALEDGTSLWIQPKNGGEEWLQVDRTTNMRTSLLETKLGMNKAWTPVLEIGAGQYLIHLPDQPWQLVNTGNKSMSTFDAIPPEVHAVHKHGSELYFFSSK